VGAAWAAKVVTTRVKASGQLAQDDRWGDIQVVLTAKKTTTTAGGKKTVKLKITHVDVPVYPNHTSRSVYINQQALPLLEQETIAQNGDLNKMQVVSGATDTSYAFAHSLQSAILKAKA
jgi:major membrane immunogen (membrane-anchored lipoprotein)